MGALWSDTAGRWAARATLLVTLWALVASVPAAGAAPASSPPLARQKPGPVTLRGIAHHVARAGFTLQTTHHGTYTVLVSHDTTVTLKGSRTTVREGDHVGVRALAEGRTLRAMWVHVYLVAGKAYTIKGIVAGVSGGGIAVASGGRTISITVPSAATVLLPTGQGTLREVHVGDRVSVRVHSIRGEVIALHIHVYKRKVAARPVQLDGTITRISGSSITVRTTAGEYAVTIARTTTIYLGARVVSPSALRVGESVRVYACCAGGPLTARSVHVSKPPPTPTTSVRGVIASISPGRLVLNTSNGTLTVLLDARTTYQLGAQSARFSDLRVGDDVSVRGHRTGQNLLATRIHVYMASRTTHTVSGTVTAVRSGRLALSSGSRVYAIVPAGGAVITIGGRPAVLSAVRVGDHVRATGHLNGNTLTAAMIAVRRTPMKIIRVTGTVSSVIGSRITITDSYGQTHAVHLAGSTTILLHGQTAPKDALFVGVHATARGPLVGGAIMASTLLLSVTPRVIEGRVRHTATTRLTIARSTSTTAIDLPGGVVALDGTRRIPPGSLHVGVFVRVRGYVESVGKVRASSIHVLHPAIDATGTVTVGPHALSLRTSAGDVYTLHIMPAARIVSERGELQLLPSDIPSGAHVHIQGTARSDGGLDTSLLVVRLASVDERTRVISISDGTLTVGTSGAGTRVRVLSTTSILQGSKPVALADLVPGDDVTVEGYGTNGRILARKILVHRRLLGVDGVILSTTSDGFVITVSTGDIRVITATETIFTGNAPASGLAVHVTGYLRGDGVLLATRVRVGKARAKTG